MELWFWYLEFRNFNSFENFRSRGKFAPRWGKYFRQNEKVTALRKENGVWQARNQRITGMERRAGVFFGEKKRGLVRIIAFCHAFFAT